MQRSKMRLAATLVAIGVLTAGVAGCGSDSDGDGGSSGTTTPSEPASITITAGDYSFEGLPETMTAGIQDVTFENEGVVDHEMVFVKVKPGTTPETVFTALGKVFEGEPFPDVRRSRQRGCQHWAGQNDRRAVQPHGRRLDRAVQRHRRGREQEGRQAALRAWHVQEGHGHR